MSRMIRRCLHPRAVIWLALVVVPIDIAAALVGGGPILLFWLSVAAMVPIAYVIGVATDRASEHTGSIVAGLLNASFGNAPELIVALFAVDRGLTDVVLGSLTGSIVSNLLLVLGVSTLVAKRGKVNRGSSALSLGLVTLALAFFAVTTWLQNGVTDADGVWAVTVPGCAVLLVAYLVVTTVSIVRGRREHRTDPERPQLRPVDGGTEDRESENGESENGHSRDVAPRGWPLLTALIVLGLATVATAFVSDILTDSITQFADAAGLPQFFVAAVIVAVVGNATEHGGAVVLAMAGKLRLSAEIAFSSSAQVATLVLPLVVLLSLALNPMTPSFRTVELITIAICVSVPAVLLARRELTRVAGVILCVAYAGIATAFVFIS